MQLLEMLSSLGKILEEIASGINIESDFRITYLNYQPMELAVELANSLQQLPSEIQNKYLNLQLRTFIYEIYYDGSLKSAIAENLDTDAGILQNNQTRGIERNYYTVLESNNCGKGFYEPGWEVVGIEDEDLLVRKDDLTLHVKRDQIEPSQRKAKTNDIVAVLMPKNRLQHGYYIAVGDAGFVNMCGNSDKKIAVDIYFHFTPQGVLSVMQSLTQQLNAMGVSFTFKVVYDPSECENRNNSGILTIQSDDYCQIYPILQQIYNEQAAHFYPNTPLFTKYLAPGLSLAEVPKQKFIPNETFGMNRCRIVANGLLAAHQSGNSTLQTRMSHIQQQFTQMNISLQHPYLNPNSDNIYLEIDQQTKM